MKLGCYLGIPRLHLIPLAIMLQNFFKRKKWLNYVNFKKKKHLENQIS